jgi:hypothetical protein
MHLSELKSLHVSQLLEMANANEIDGANRLRKQELIFALLKNRAKKGEAIFGDGTLEVLPTVSASFALPTPAISRAPTTSTSVRPRFAASTCIPAIRSKARSARRRMASATSRW